MNIFIRNSEICKFHEWFSKFPEMFNMRSACDTTFVNLLIQFFLNTLQYFLCSSLQCGNDSLLEFLVYWKKKEWGIDQSL